MRVDGRPDPPADEPLASSERLGWHGVDVRHYRRSPRATTRPCRVPAYHLYVNVGRPVRVAWRFPERTFRGVVPPGHFLLAPPRSGWTIAWEGPPFECVRVRLDRALVDGGHDALPPRFAVRDAFVEHAARVLVAACGSGGAHYAEAVATALARHARARYADAPPAPDVSALGAERLARALDFIETNLEARPTVADIARAAGLSPYHFARAFKAAMGDSPHRYVSARRIAVARTLLTEDDVTLAEVACRAGFAHQSHLASALRAAGFDTPAVLRRASSRKDLLAAARR